MFRRTGMSVTPPTIIDPKEVGLDEVLVEKDQEVEPDEAADEGEE